VFFSFFLSLTAQEKDNHQIISKSLTDYYSLASENIHLHFNKSIYLTNETIWLKGYIIDKKSNGLNYQTTNVYVKILDQDKNEVESKLFLASNGIIIGDFKLNENYSSGTYFIHTYTNFMNNFEEDESSIFPIEIVNTKDSFTNNKNTSLKNASIEIIAEGGKILFDSDNTIGVKIKNCTGGGIKLSTIKVYDGNNNIVTTFSTNEQGFGKFDLLKTKSEQYKIVIEYNSEKVEKNLPLVVAEGINISVNNYSDENKIFLKIKTNQFTFNKIKEKNYTLAIQKNDQIILSDFYFENSTKDIMIDKVGLLKGVNIIRILDENNISISERIIYNPIKNDSKIILEKIKINKDSLLIKGKILNKIANFSISILPLETTSSFENDAINSQLNFNTYLTNSLENYSYYFKDFNRKKQYELDLVLLNQNASKYEWNNLMNKKPSIKYPFDVGLTIEGTINQALSIKNSYKIKLSSIINGINTESKIDSKNRFAFENLLAVDSTTFFVSLINDKAKYETFNSNIRVLNNKNVFFKTITNNKIVCNNINYTPMSAYNTDFPYLANTTVLKEVVLTETVKEKLENTQNYNNRAGAQGFKINEDKAELYYDILGFIRSHGFDVNTTGGSVQIVSRTANSFKGSLSPTIYVDDVPLTNFDLLYNLNLREIDEIYINKRGFGQGMSAPSGSIRIYTKKKFGSTSVENINSKSVFIKDGFQKEKPFKNPEYTSYENQSFRKHGTINWIPNLYTNEMGNFEFKIPTFNQESVLINIQGIDNEGNFYYENIELNVN
jgi:hypothetical protein